MKTRNIVVVFAVMLCLAACTGPRIIPDRVLVKIFHDVYLTNAYADMNRLPLDSLNIYEPLFAHYGYTSEDIQYTIGNFAKRKSARLSDDVVEVAIEMIRAENRLYSGRIAIRDTVEMIARKRFSSVVYSDSLIRVRRIRDTADLRIRIPARVGSYDVSLSYFIDSTDRNGAYRTELYFVDGNGRQAHNTIRRMNQSERGRITATLTADEPYRWLVLDLNDYPEEMTTPDMRIDSLVVTYYLPTGVAVDSMARSWFDYGTADSLFDLHYETHIVPPFADSLGTASR